MNIVEIKKHVTYFSEELINKAKHEQDIVVGGEILSIISPVNTDYPMHIVTLDDQVGITHAFVPESMMLAFPNELQIGKHVFLEGFVNIITRHLKKGTKLETKKDVSIIAYGMKDITNVGAPEE